jgi:chitinase
LSAPSPSPPFCRSRPSPLTDKASSTSTVANKAEIIAYIFPRGRVLRPDEVAAKKLTRINYAFANVADGKVVEGFAHDNENFAILKGLKQQNPDLIECIGLKSSIVS